MHSVTLFYHDAELHRHDDRPIATVTVDEDALVEIRMQDGTVLFSMPLDQLGYRLMWGLYPITAPEPPCHPRGLRFTDANGLRPADPRP